MKNFPDKIMQNVIANVITYGVLAALGITIAFLLNEGVALTVSVCANILLIGILLWLLTHKPKVERPEKQPEQVEVTVDHAERPKRYDFLPDPKKMTELNLDNSLLTEVHGKLHAQALKWSNDAKLVSFSVHVWPFRDYGYKVGMQLRFFSSWARQTRVWAFDDSGEIREAGLPTYEREERSTFDELPWVLCPDWLRMVQKAYVQVGQLPESEWSSYRAQTYSPLDATWIFTFVDGVSGRQYTFDWSPELGLKQR